MKAARHIVIAMSLGLAVLNLARAADPCALRQAEERLSFQSHAPWSPREELDADVAMVYGIDKTLPERIETWRRRGYRVHVMTGVSWGHYQDYEHYNEEAQVGRDGKPRIHGGSGNIYYMSPGIDYGKYLCQGVQRALDAGAEAIHLEEPEFWVSSGYEENFKKEWQAYYGVQWQAPHMSPDAQYRASKLKYFLYRRALAQIFDYVREYNQKTGKQVRCYVPTHSLINYAHWRIVSPESSLIDVGCDGYIAQVWTGTARTPNTLNGKRQERTFETAFLEYGSMLNLARASGRRIWFLNDPVEDNPDHTWQDYQYNWEQTLAASLFQADVHHYEILPWPNRIFRGRYPSGGTAEKLPIPPAYETELQTVFHALGEMKQPAEKVRWERSGTQGVGVLVSDTMMFQRGEPESSDPQLGSFYGLALPLLKAGIPVEPVQIETATMKKDFLNNFKVLLLTYEGQKPPAPGFHDALAEWVRGGGALVVADDDRDPYNKVKEWWNTAPLAYVTPRQHLFEKLGLERDAMGLARIGKGAVLREQQSPAALTRKKDGAATVLALAKQAAESCGVAWITNNALVLRRGPYVIAASLDESSAGNEPCRIAGRYIDLFDSEQAIVRDPVLQPGQRRLFYDLAEIERTKPQLLTGACRVRDWVVAPDKIMIATSGIEGSPCVMHVALPVRPGRITAGGAEIAADRWDYAKGVLRLRFTNRAEGVPVVIEY